jgi:hypothetical protein
VVRVGTVSVGVAMIGMCMSLMRVCMARVSMSMTLMSMRVVLVGMGMAVMNMRVTLVRMGMAFVGDGGASMSVSVGMAMVGMRVVLVCMCMALVSMCVVGMSVGVVGIRVMSVGLVMMVLASTLSAQLIDEHRVRQFSTLRARDDLRMAWHWTSHGNGLAAQRRMMHERWPVWTSLCLIKCCMMAPNWLGCGCHGSGYHGTAVGIRYGESDGESAVVARWPSRGLFLVAR